MTNEDLMFDASFFADNDEFGELGPHEQGSEMKKVAARIADYLDKHFFGGDYEWYVGFPTAEDWHNWSAHWRVLSLPMLERHCGKKGGVWNKERAGTFGVYVENDIVKWRDHMVAIITKKRYFKKKEAEARAAMAMVKDPPAPRSEGAKSASAKATANQEVRSLTEEERFRVEMPPEIPVEELE